MPGTISLPDRYDFSSRVRIFTAVLFVVDYLLRSRGLRSLSADAFNAHVLDTVALFESRGGDIVSEGRPYHASTAGITSRTVANFLALDRNGVANAHERTIRYFDAFLRVSNLHYRDVTHSTEDHIRSLATETARFYTPFDHSKRFARRAAEGLDQLEGTFVIAAPPSHIPSPADAKFAILYLKRIPGSLALFCQYLPVPRPVGYSRFDLDGVDLSDWREDRYAGIAVSTRDGIICQLASFATKIPAYLVLQRGGEEDAPAAPMYLSPSIEPGFYANTLRALQRSRNPAVDLYFDQLPWIL